MTRKDRLRKIRKWTVARPTVSVGTKILKDTIADLSIGEHQKSRLTKRLE